MSQIQRPCAGSQSVITLDREGASEHLDDGAVEEVLSEHGGVDGGRHEDDPNFRVGLDHVSEDHHEEVRLRGHNTETPSAQGSSLDVIIRRTTELTLMSLSWISSTIT